MGERIRPGSILVVKVTDQYLRDYKPAQLNRAVCASSSEGFPETLILDLPAASMDWNEKHGSHMLTMREDTLWYLLENIFWLQEQGIKVKTEIGIRDPDPAYGPETISLCFLDSWSQMFFRFFTCG